MEYSLTYEVNLGGETYMGLNPCSNGILSDISYTDGEYLQESLNPCSNGILSDLSSFFSYYGGFCLNPCSNGILSDGEERRRGCKAWFVLILVLMECSLTKHLRVYNKQRAS